MRDESPPPIGFAELERWELFGATWRARTQDGQTVLDLCTCTGELVETREPGDPRVRALAEQPSSGRPDARRSEP